MQKGPPWTRRHVLRSLLATPAALACGSSKSATPSVPSERVLIVGAGAAGLTVANALTTAGIETLVLEGRDRLGGRIWSTEIAGAPVDLGGMWLSGSEGNPVACILRAENRLWSPAEPLDLSTRAFDAARGQAWTVPELLGVAARLDEFDLAAPDLAAAIGPDATLGQMIDAFLEDAALTEPERRLTAFGLRTLVEISYGTAPERIGFAGIDTSNAFPGGEHLPNGGYSGLIAALARGVDVRLGTRVVRIEHGDRGVIVESDSETFEGSHVVVTVPLGVLKAGSITFSPPLPETKQSAIEQLEMGALEKVVLRYDTAFWQSGSSGNFLYASQQSAEMPLFVDLTPYVNDQPTLIAFYCGDCVDVPSDTELVSRATAIVREMSGVDGPEPIESRVTRWREDPMARGSYVYLPVGTSADDLDTLAAPVGERLLFAGEATSNVYSGYVHGAVVSGMREASRLLGGAEVRLDSGLVLKEGCSAGS